jgi:hypothetical protein
MKPHAEQQTGVPACADCHAEHREVARLAGAADATCVSCHGNVLAHVKDPVLLSTRPKDVLTITSFGRQHPDFSPRSDPDKLPFSHALHLDAAGIPNGEGKLVTLRCIQCHKLVETKGVIDPAVVNFRDHCQNCHELTVTPGLPDAPHGVDLPTVYGAILQAYAGNRDIVGKSPEETRRILTSLPRVAPDTRAAIAYEHVRKVKCVKCHEIDHSGAHIVTKPEIPTRWLFKARFTHTNHRGPLCESCHETARRSTSTSDVLVPHRKNCTGCHGGQSPKISGCKTCHGYHTGSKLLLRTMVDTGGGSRMIETVLLWAIVLLLLVVLLPVGLAFYQRIRAGTRESAAERTAAAPRAPTTKIPALKATDTPAPPSRPAPPPPAPPPQKPVEVTRLAAVPAEPEGSATEMVEWYGMLQCTSGALEGQHFIIEKDGIYIGRDPAMSQVSISDNRISKRHVRIVPRDGKVVAIDQNSTNGTFLGKAGGERITEVQLRRGDVLVLADNAATFVYQI